MCIYILHLEELLCHGNPHWSSQCSVCANVDGRGLELCRYYVSERWRFVVLIASGLGIPILYLYGLQLELLWFHFAIIPLPAGHGVMTREDVSKTITVSHLNSVFRTITDVVLDFIHL